MTGEGRAAVRASIIIVTHGQRALTERCLRSLEHCLGPALGAEWELVLVDNASPDDTPALLRSWSDRATVLLLEQNRDFSGGCNAGAAAASGEVLLFLNNDTEVTPGALEALAAQALEPGVSIAGCRLLFPDGTLQHAGVGFLTSRAFEGRAMPEHLFHHQDAELPAARGCFELECMTAACMAVRARTFGAIGGFDEGFRNGFEDVDLCLRARLLGERIVYRGDAVVMHHEGASRGRGPEQYETAARRATVRRNIARLIDHWGPLVAADDDLALRLWDAELRGWVPDREPCDAGVLVLGEPAGIGPGGAEARAWVAALAAAGHEPVAGNHTRMNVVARLSEPMATLVRGAHERMAGPGTRCVIVPSGARDAYEIAAPAVVRLAQARTAIPLGRAESVWAASPALADELIAGGLPARRVAVVPSPVLPAPAGEGGAGVLALLPAHDRARARAVLEALRALPARVPVRLLPSVLARGLAREVAAALPGAELLGPCSDERRFAALAASADVVLAADPSDRFERRALVAAGVGAAPITTDPAGPAAAILGRTVACDPGPETVGVRLRDVLANPGERAARVRAVGKSCNPTASAALLDAHVPSLEPA